MDEKKKQVLFSISIGKSKTTEYLREIKILERQLKQQYDIRVSNKLDKVYEQFQTSLYNLYDAMSKVSNYFDDYKKIETIINKSVAHTPEKSYTFGELFGTYRNMNEHPEKINQCERYILFKKYITKRQLIKLYNCCNKVLSKELNKFTLDEVLECLFSNVKTKSQIDILITNIVNANKQIKDERPDIYNLNNKIINEFNVTINTTMSMEKLDSIVLIIESYLHNDIYKKAFVDRYGLRLYNYILNTCENEKFSFNEYNNRINHFINKIIKIEQKFKKD